METELIVDSEYSRSNNSLLQLSHEERRALVECVHLLHSQSYDSALLISAFVDVNGVMFDVDHKTIDSLIENLEVLGVGYKVYEFDKSENESIFDVFIAGSEERYEMIPDLQSDDYTHISGSKVEQFRGAMGQDSYQSDIKFNSKNTRLDDRVGGTYSQEELMDLNLSEVAFPATEEGMESMLEYTGEIRGACEKFDAVSESLIGTLALMDAFGARYSTCTLPEYSTVLEYVRERERIGRKNGWDYVDVVSEALETAREDQHRFEKRIAMLEWDCFLKFDNQRLIE